MSWLAVFVLMFATDVVWALYVRHTAEGHAARASLYASAIAVFNGLVAISYIADHRVLIPMALGAAVGTYVVVYRRPHHANG